MTASVTKILRKSCGVKTSGWPSAADAGAGQGSLEDLAQRAVADGPVLTEDGALEQQPHGRVPGFLVGVVAGHQRDGVGAVADPAHDRAEDVGELGADQQQSFGAGLGRRDLQ
jgi:hypothetical protein